MKFAPRQFWFYVCLTIVGLLVYGFYVGNPYYYDDQTVLGDNAWIRNLTAPGLWFNSIHYDSNHIFPGFRPVLMWSYWLNLHVLGDSPTSFRVGNLALHVLNSCLLVRFVSFLLPERRRNLISFAVGFLFLLHPMQTVAINFLWKRSSILEATFTLLALLLHAWQRRKGSYSWKAVGLQLFLYILAILTKESGGVLPLYLLAYDLALMGPARTFHDRTTRPLWFALGGVALIFFYLRTVVLLQVTGSQMTFLEDPRTLGSWNYFQNSLRILPKYFALWLSPQPRIIDDPPLVFSFPWLESFVVFACVALSIFLFRRFRHALVRFSILLVWISFLPTIGIVPLYFVMDQSRMYFTLAGLSSLFILLLTSVSAVSEKFQVATIVAVITAYGAFSLVQNSTYAEPVRIWNDVIETYPASDLAWNHLGIALQNLKRPHAAAEAFRQAASHSKYAGYKVRELHNRFLSGEPARTLELAAVSISEESLSTLDHVNLAILLAELGKEKSAEKMFLALIARQPRLGIAHLNLGILWERMGKTELARHAYENAGVLMQQKDVSVRKVLAR